jgi:nondiscriminating glutamyl-tRNA synthetase
MDWRMDTMDDNDFLRVRFAPSPTGYLHIGGARTALFNFLYSRRHNGTFVLRVEDTDVKREAADSYGQILDDLRWLGIHWDEGPFRQTERLSVYRRYASELLEKGLVYPCYCTPEELEQKRKDQMARGENPAYDGTCRSLSMAQRYQKENAGVQPCLRFRADSGPVAVQDVVRGEVSYDRDFTGDFVIIKSDGIPAYNFAVVVDDLEMGVTLVMRGEEHLVNTPRQILIYQALDRKPPLFAHLSMILAPDRSKMSKRHGTVAVSEYREKGYLPQALVNYIALLGWAPEGDEEIMSLSRMSEIFSLERVSRSPAVYDEKKLQWVNSRYIKETPKEELLDLLLPFWMQADYLQENDLQNRELLMEIAEAVKPRLTLLTGIAGEARIFFDDSFEMGEDVRECMEWDTTPAVLRAFREVLGEMERITPGNFMDAIKQIQERSGAKGKKLYMPLRAALTGQAHGVELQHVLTLLKKDQVIKRLDRLLNGTPVAG